jgi:hypothetical protein
MTSAQFRAAIETLGLSQEAAGKFLGLSGRQGQRFANNERKIPGAVAKLLRLMIKLNLKPEDVK